MSILLEAQQITSGSRNQNCSAEESFTRIANICKELDIEVTSAMGSCMFLIVLKLVRESFKHKRDNLVDIAGYARLLSILYDEENTDPKEEEQ